MKAQKKQAFTSVTLKKHLNLKKLLQQGKKFIFKNVLLPVLINLIAN